MRAWRVCLGGHECRELQLSSCRDHPLELPVKCDNKDERSSQTLRNIHVSLIQTLPDTSLCRSIAQSGHSARNDALFPAQSRALTRPSKFSHAEPLSCLTQKNPPYKYHVVWTLFSGYQNCLGRNCEASNMPIHSSTPLLVPSLP